MVNPYVLIATHQRLSITKKNIECILACGVNVILVVTDDGEYVAFRQMFLGITVVQHSNKTLGSKWQSGVMAAKELQADPLIVNGSDDILCPKFYERIESSLSKGNHFVGLKSWYVYDLKRAYKFEYLASLPLGGGRAYSIEMLRTINYSLFDQSRDRCLDDLSYGNVLNSGLKYTILNEPLILSVKGGWPVMNPTQKIFVSQNAKLVDTISNPKKLLETFNYVRD
jgi:hypothetical protein